MLQMNLKNGKIQTTKKIIGNSMKIALAQIDVKAGDPQANFETIEKHVRWAKAQDVKIIAFSEMCVGGYFVGDLWNNDEFCRELMSYNQKIQELSDDIVIIYGNVYLEERENIGDGLMIYNARGFDGRKIRYNAAYAYYNKKPLKREARSNVIPAGIQPKTLLPNYRYFDDKRYFYTNKDWDLSSSFSVSSPFVAEINGEEFKIGVQLCEDMWCEDYRNNPALSLKDSDIIINLSASPWTHMKNNSRDRRVKNLFDWKERKYTYDCTGTGEVLKTHEHYVYPPYAYVNCVGSQNNGKNILTFDGASTVYGQDGRAKILANSNYEEELLVFDHERIPYETKKRKRTAAIERKYQAIIRGIQHMSEVTGLEKYVIGLSGGVDSAVVACMLVDALGRQNVVAVNMPSKYNSKKTKDAAAKIARVLGIPYIVAPIDKIVKANMESIELAKFKLSSDKTKIDPVNDLTQENIQAKIRGASILSNLAGELGRFFPCNGNKVEIATGYATLYGDWGGAIAPIGDLTKAEVYDIARYINRKFRKSPISKNLLPNRYYEFDKGKIQPSAELKNDQVDPIKVGYHCALIQKFLDFKKYSAGDVMEWYINNELAEKLGVSEVIIHKTHPMNGKEFIEDLRWLCDRIRGNVFKRVQSPPIIITSKTSFGFDLRESILPKFKWSEREKELAKRIIQES